MYSAQSITQDFWRQANKKNTGFNDNTKAESTTIFDSTLVQILQEILDYERNSRNIKGVSTAVIMPGQGTWAGVSGVSHDTVEVKQDMLFGISSITKNYTAPLILKLAEEGILTLDDSLHKWLPNYDNIDSTITIRQLLNMTSGIYDFVNDNYSSFTDMLHSDPTRLWTPEEILSSMVGPPNFPPGTDWSYNSTSYTLLGMIIREATGSSISVELRNRFLEPLALNKTYLAGEDTLIGEIAHPWYGYPNLQDYSFINDTASFSLLWTGGAMFSTARDVAQWAQALFGGAVLNQEYTNQMVTFIPVNNSDYPPEITGYGFGAWKFNIQGRELWGGVGLWYGYVDLVAYLPEHDISIAVLLNERYNISLKALFRNAFDILTILIGSVTGIEDERAVMPMDYIMSQNYPNPFNPSTNIEFTLPKSEYVELKIYNILGKEVATLILRNLNKGTHTYTFDGKNLASGVYYYRIQAGKFHQVKKMIILK